MNLIEKILARESSRSKVEPGDVVVVDVECALLHDLSARSARRVFEEQVGGELAHPDRIVVVFDHMFSPPTEDRATVLRATRQFCRERGLRLFDCGNGNLHQVAAQNGLIRPGALVIGSDSHSPVHGVFGAFSAWLGNDSCAATVLPFSRAWFRVPETILIELTGEPRPGTTARDIALWLTGRVGEGALNYQAIRFCGDYIDGLSLWDRWLFTLMAVDIGAKCAYMEPDEEVERFAASVGVDGGELLRDDPGYRYAQRWSWDVSAVEPQIAVPPTVGNVHPVSEYVGTPVDWAELGGHGGGRQVDFELALDAMGDGTCSPTVNFNLVPGTRHVFSQALESGLVADLHAARRHVVPGQHRRQPGRQHGRAGRVGDDDLHARSQLPGPQRKPEGADVPRVRRDRRRERRRRPDHRPAGVRMSAVELEFAGRVWCFGDNVPTDEIVPTRWVFSPMEEIRTHVLENLKPGFAADVRAGDLLIGGSHFGQSSGRAVAPKALKSLGVACIVADSFARTFLRNCFEIGLPLVECPGAGAAFADGQEAVVDVAGGTVRNVSAGTELAGTPTDPFLLGMLRAGGLIPLVREQGPRLGLT